MVFRTKLAWFWCPVSKDAQSPLDWVQSFPSHERNYNKWYCLSFLYVLWNGNRHVWLITSLVWWVVFTCHDSILKYGCSGIVTCGVFILESTVEPTNKAKALRSVMPNGWRRCNIVSSFFREVHRQQSLEWWSHIWMIILNVHPNLSIKLFGEGWPCSYTCLGVFMMMMTT